MNLLCRIGLHLLTWRPDTTDGWLHTSRCTRCGQTISRR